LASSDCGASNSRTPPCSSIRICEAGHAQAQASTHARAMS
jgi:hypothetical protein